MKYAVIKTGGKQYRVSEGDVISVERLVNDGKKDIVFADVLLYHADGDIKVGTPFVSGIMVKGTIVEEKKGEKIRVAKYKAKVRYRRAMGHRQLLSLVKIDSILADTKRVEKKAARAASEKESSRKPRARKVAI
ncbi:MAG: 50S ribosomal protein L21 [Candidatus Levybacteria bacterium]|nr:50S ribosomal protein L21 [Candidatus Levybacteria bacterium]